MNSVILEISNLCKTDYDFFISKKNVNGVGYGYKEINGVQSDIPCFKVLVESKESLSNLTAEDLVPKDYKGHKTDIIEVGKIIAHGPFQQKIRPAEGGVSVGVTQTFIVGTLGCRTEGHVNYTNEIYALSNNHVMSLENTVLKGTNILQPGYGDGGSSTNDILGTLYRCVPIRFSTSTTTPVNYVDCALSLVTIPSLINTSVYSIGAITDIAPAMVGLPVQKFGRTTQYTTGTITALGATVNVSYTDGTALFADQIVATAMSSPGDSGSIILDMQNRVVGLLFAGSTTITLINDITNVLTFLGIRLP